MSAALVAKGVGRAISAAAPAVRDYVVGKLNSATGNKVGSVEDLDRYIGTDPARARVVLTTAASAGIDPEGALAGLTLSNPILREARSRAIQLHQQLGAEVVNHFQTSDRNAVISATQLADLNRARVAIALKVFGSERAYYACQGLGPEHFAAARG